MLTKMWTRIYRPFTMGGKLHQVIKCEIEGGEVIDLGKGFEGFEIKTPKGSSVIIEKESGAIVGTNLEEVKNDINSCKDIDVMKKQIKDALKESQNVALVTLEEFWLHYPR